MKKRNLLVSILLGLCVCLFSSLFVACGQTKHTITFKQAGFEDVTRKVVDGGTLTDIPAPQHEDGYEVVWNVTSFDGVTGDIVVTAEKTPITYSITYVLNGGINSETNPATYTIESGAIPLYKPTKTYGTTFVN